MHRAVSVVLLILVAATGLAAPPAADPVPWPDLSALRPDVRRVLGRARAELERGLDGTGRITDPKRLAGLFGHTGLLFHAHLLLDTAVACYRRAQQLDPGDVRWPYYQGYAREQAGATREAALAYARALALDPGLAVANLRLGRVELDLGDLDRARTLLGRARKVSALSASADFELGRLDYARGDLAGAQRDLLRVLKAAPGATRAHYTLALVYRDRGELKRARRQLALSGAGAPPFPDPLVSKLAELSTGQRMLFHAGMNAAYRDDYGSAARLFRRGLSQARGNSDARVSLARYLYLSGDVQGARSQLQRALSGGGGPALGHFLLGLLEQQAGRGQAANKRFAAALALQPSHAGAHFYLGAAYWRSGDFGAAARHFGAALAAAPDNEAAARWQVLAAIVAGWDEAQVRALLETAHARFPDSPALRYLLAALLSAARDASVRDAPRALALAQGLYAAVASPEHVELLAMAGAAAGDYTRAESLQRQLLEAALDGLRLELASRLEVNLKRYQAHLPAAAPWDLRALSRLPAPGDVAKVFANYPASKPF